MRGWSCGILSVLILVSLSSCSWFRTTDECRDGDCSVARVSSGSDTGEEWFCYGVPVDRTWECHHEPHPEKIVAVIPEAFNEDAPGPGTLQTRQEAPPGLSAPAPAEPAPATMTSGPSPEPVTREPADTVLAQPPEYYTVQLIAMQEKEQVLDYARQNGLDHPIYVRIQSQGTDWYVLLLGFYPDRDTAEFARKQWEGARILKIRPWIRKLAPLQEAVRLAAG